MSDDVITVWPCDHGNVLVEHGDVPLGMTCHECGAHPRRYVAVDALLSGQAIKAASRASRAVRDQIEYFGASDYDGPGMTEAAIRAAVNATAPEAP